MVSTDALVSSGARRHGRAARSVRSERAAGRPRDHVWGPGFVGPAARVLPDATQGHVCSHTPGVARHSLASRGAAR